MAGSLNKVMLIGRLGRDPEVRTFQNGGRVANLRIATSETWRDKASGERKERTEWHTVTIHADGLVRIAEQYLAKGVLVYVEGQLETRKWQDQSGQDRYSTEVVIRHYSGTIKLLEFKDDGGEGRQSSRSGYDQSPEGYRGGQGGGKSGYGDDIMDDEIPF